jgi:hypothetical protein
MAKSPSKPTGRSRSRSSASAPATTSAKASTTPAEGESVNVRRISNGFVVTKNGTDAKGMYKPTEVFHPNNPLEAPPSQPPKGRR